MASCLEFGTYHGNKRRTAFNMDEKGNCFLCLSYTHDKI